MHCSKIKLSTIFFLILYCFPAQSQDKPNVILILADDMALGDISAINGGISKTPEIDALINESLWFDRAFSGSAVCTPSRAALLTGRYPHRTGAVTLNMERFPVLSRMNKEEKTLGDLFSANGYVTGLIGKWHLGDGAEYHPMRRGFQEFEGFKGYDVSDTYYSYRLDIQGEYEAFDGVYLTENLSQRAIDFVDRHRQEPFFLHLAHYAPHRPLSAPEDLVQAYEKEGLDRNTAIVYAMIEVMDHGIGQLMDALDSLGIREQTIVIFASDNGPDPLVGPRFNKNMRGTKYTVYDGGIHVPFLVSWQGTVEPGRTDTIIQFTDVWPTLLELCRLEPLGSDFPGDGGSFAGLLNGEGVNLPQYRFWQWNRGVPWYSHNAALRDGDWKLVRPYVLRNIPDGASTEKPVLYNLKNDPEETTDLSETESLRYDIMRVKLENLSRSVEHSRLSQGNE